MEKTLATSNTKRSSPSPSTAVNTRPAGFKRRTRQRLSDSRESVRESSVEDDDEGVEEKIEALQTIVPGGTALGVDALFEETASYILALQCQINAIKVLTSFLESCEKDDDMKFGG
ncbi:Transcription factor PAR2 [Raphanus sativus]|uniref:Transcription factor PAR2-like n=1 Tax=Raphanus sativus TaxID=3726 RepID=A0A6J0M2Y9_RAPSA|nr:transcription factor PAR2-like [Raphanus sativus]XP_056863471.1 transcription factor PAR2-like [Raphanus sativus]KAJ4905389.1 Transcription factor PAR2 [Raphanus sativus]KAJ4905390.1 Transcription factor PAR2 [Raphanus sativus]